MSRVAIFSIILLFSACGKAINRVPEVQVAINLPLTDPTVTDPCSGAKYFLGEGSQVKAPAVVSLKEYNVRISTNTIQVSN